LRRYIKEVIKPRSALPPLLSPLDDRRPEHVHWVAGAYTRPLFSSTQAI
jgi:hypothetical protein